MLNAFCNLSGDTNPLHCDVNFAQSKGYPGKVVYGMLSASLYSRLAGVYLPGRNCLLQSVHADFLRPVFVGDELTVIGKIFEKNDSVHQIVIKAVLCNQHGEKVSKAKIEAGVI
jgi:3-hydroxybutyryl-CoA dehydratase